MRFVVEPAPDGRGSKAAPCPACRNYLQEALSGLNEREQTYLPGDIKEVKTASGKVLSYAVESMINQPYGFFTLWGGPGSAKTLALKAVVAGVARRGIRAKYVKAKAVEERIWAMFRGGDSLGIHEYTGITVLAIDEMNDISWHVDVVRTQMQHLIDLRYEDAQRSTGRTVTLFGCQYDPNSVDKAAGVENNIPEMVASRMRTGLFAIPWPERFGEPDAERIVSPGFVVKRSGTWQIPPIFHCDQPDARPYLRRADEGNVETLKA